MSKDLSDWGDPPEKNSQPHSWNSIWKGIVSTGGLVLIFYEAMFAPEVNVYIVAASLMMMGFPIVRWLDKL